MKDGTIYVEQVGRNKEMKRNMKDKKRVARLKKVVKPAAYDVFFQDWVESVAIYVAGECVSCCILTVRVLFTRGRNPFGPNNSRASALKCPPEQRSSEYISRLFSALTTSQIACQKRILTAWRNSKTLIGRRPGLRAVIRLGDSQDLAGLEQAR